MPFILRTMAVLLIWMTQDRCLYLQSGFTYGSTQYCRCARHPIGNVRVIKPGLAAVLATNRTPCGRAARCTVQPATWRSLRCNHSDALKKTLINIAARTRHAFDMTIVSQANEQGELMKKALRINSNGGAYAAHGPRGRAHAITNCFQTYIAKKSRSGNPRLLIQTFRLRQPCVDESHSSLLESQMDDVALAHGWDPVEFRRWNMQKDGFLDPFDRFEAVKAMVSKPVLRKAVN